MALNAQFPVVVTPHKVLMGRSVRIMAGQAIYGLARIRREPGVFYIFTHRVCCRVLSRVAFLAELHYRCFEQGLEIAAVRIVAYRALPLFDRCMYKFICA